MICSVKLSIFVFLISKKLRISGGCYSSEPKHTKFFVLQSSQPTSLLQKSSPLRCMTFQNVQQTSVFAQDRLEICMYPFDLQVRIFVTDG